MAVPMAKQAAQHLLLDLEHIDELYNSPPVNPFVTRQTAVLGQSGLELLETQVAAAWPFWPERLEVTIRLPAGQVTPELEAQTRQALQRYCAGKIAANRQRRQVMVQFAWRQLLLACVFVALVTLALAWLGQNPLGLAPYLDSLLSALLWFAAVLALFGSQSALIFGWTPFVRENALYRRLQRSEITLAPAVD